MNFNFKIKLFNAICKEIGANKKILKEVNNNINFVKEKRDMVAHRGAMIHSMEEGIKLYTKRATRVMKKKSELLLTEESVKEIDEKRLAALNCINKIYAKAGFFRDS